jgi:hypothetical protein
LLAGRGDGIQDVIQREGKPIVHSVEDALAVFIRAVWPPSFSNGGAGEKAGAPL